MDSPDDILTYDNSSLVGAIHTEGTQIYFHCINRISPYFICREREKTTLLYDFGLNEGDEMPWCGDYTFKIDKIDYIHAAL